MNNVENNDGAKKQNNKLIVFLKEHEELIHLLSHEDTVGWNLVNFYIVMNFALVSSIGLLLTQESLERLISIIITLCVMGFSISGTWFFLYGRVRLHHRMDLFRLYKIEKELQSMGYPLDTTESTYQKSHRGKTPFKNMKYLDPEEKERKMHFYELIETFKSIHIIMGIVPIIWLLVTFRFAHII